LDTETDTSEEKLEDQLGALEMAEACIRELKLKDLEANSEALEHYEVRIEQINVDAIRHWRPDVGIGV
jgi:hypothetical protein